MRIRSFLKKSGFYFFGAVLFFSFFMMTGCKDEPKLTTEYQSVFLDSGQVFFGKVSRIQSDYVQLDDVFYIQSPVNPETGQPVNVLFKRGSEWHGPDKMFINARHIVIIEPVAPTSKVAQLIAEAKAQPQGAK